MQPQLLVGQDTDFHNYCFQKRVTFSSFHSLLDCTSHRYCFRSFGETAVVILSFAAAAVAVAAVVVGVERNRIAAVQLVVFHDCYHL